MWWVSILIWTLPVMWWVCNEGGHVYYDKSDEWTDELILRGTDTD